MMFMNYITRFAIKGGKSIFDGIYVFAPTINTDRTFQLLDTVNKDVAEKTVKRTQLDPEIIDAIVNDPQEDEQGRPNDVLRLVYIDDYASNKKAMRSDLVAKLFMQSRHNTTCVILTSQYYFRIPCDIRENMSHASIFRLKKPAELQLIRDQVSTPEFHDEYFDEIYYEATKERFNFLFCDMMEHKFYKNFETEFQISDVEEEEAAKHSGKIQEEAVSATPPNEEETEDDIDRQIELAIQQSRNR